MYKFYEVLCLIVGLISEKNSDVAILSNRTNLYKIVHELKIENMEEIPDFQFQKRGFYLRSDDVDLSLRVLVDSQTLMASLNAEYRFTQKGLVVYKFLKEKFEKDGMLQKIQDKVNQYF